MNKRLLAYLRSLGLKSEATDAEAWDFFSGLRGLQRSIGNALNYVEEDAQARTNCDLAIRALGYDPADPSRMLEPEPTADDPQVEPQRTDDAAVAERSRIRAISDIAELAGISSEMRQQAIDEAWTVDRAREAFMTQFRQRSRAEVPSEPPAGHSVDRSINLAVLECAMLHRENIDPTQSLYRDGRRVQGDAVEQASERAWHLRHASLADIVRQAARIDGVRGLPDVGAEGLLQAYVEGYGRAMSTSALSAIFTTNINSSLMSAYDATPDSTTGGWVRDGEVSDFRSNERVRMESGGALTKHSRGGEADHTEYEDAVETFKIARYSRQFVIDEMDIIDDNFGATTGHVPRDMGVAARQLRPDLIYSVLMANANMRDGAALFVAGHGNLTTSSALTADNLKVAIKKFLIQQENGRNISVMPSFLIVPPALVWTAKELLNSASVVVAGSTDLVRPEYNALSSENLTIVVDPRLENGLTDPATGTALSGSATTWFLAATANYHTIECAYRRGTGRAPQVRSQPLTQGRWGLGWDIKMDIGAKALDWRGLAKCTA